jgi:hypothetical protein
MMVSIPLFAVTSYVLFKRGNLNFNIIYIYI